jgi:molybdopterin synthase catalytic subunit
MARTIHTFSKGFSMPKQSPSIDQWLAEAKAAPSASRCGMYLAHNGTVRELPKKLVREGIDDGSKVTGMSFSYDHDAVEAAAQEALTWEGIEYVKYWLNEGTLSLGDDIMYIFIGGDIRPHVIDALQKLVGKIKTELVSEVEITE